MFKVRWGWLSLVAATLICTGGAAWAQEPGEADLDALISATESDSGALALARRQAGNGDLTGAAVTLERSLLLRSGPSSDHVRLYYASILCRLGDTRRGIYQTTIASGGDDAAWSEARQACGQAASSGETTRGNGVVGRATLGVGYQSDARGAMVIEFEVPGFPATTEEGWAVLGTLDVDGRFAARRSGHGYAGVNVQTNQSISGFDGDFIIGEARLGYARYLGGGGQKLSGGAVVGHANLQGDGIVTEYGGQAEYQWGTGDGRWRLNAEAVHQDYEGSSRDGGKYDLAIRYLRSTGDDRAWMIGAALELKDAEYDALGYFGGRVFAAAQIPIRENGTYFTGSAVLRMVDYGDAMFLPDRRERRAHLRAGIGIPTPYENLFVEAAITHSARWFNENSGFASSNSTGGELRLVYRFGQVRQ